MAKKDTKTTVVYADMTQEALAVLAEEQAAKIAELEGTVADLENTVADMDKEMDKLSAKKTEKVPTVTVDKVKYAIVISSFKFDGKIVTADDIQKDSKLAAKLVEEGIGALKEI